MFKVAKRKCMPELRGALQKKTARNRRFYNIRCKIKYKKTRRESTLHDRALSEWEDYYPEGKSLSFFRDPKTKSKEPFLLSMPDQLFLKALTFPPTLILTFAILYALRDVIDPYDADAFAITILCTFMLLNGAFVKIAYYIYEKPRFERAKKRFTEDHPAFAKKLWPEIAT